MKSRATEKKYRIIGLSMTGITINTLLCFYIDFLREVFYSMGVSKTKVFRGSLTAGDAHE